MAVVIRPFKESDFPSVKKIYQQGIDTGDATFQTKAKNWAEWNASMLPECRLVAEEDQRVIGWAGLSAVSSRCVYAGVAEVTIYIGTEAHGKGLGTRLLAELVKASEVAGYWTLQSGVFPENKSSISVHKKNGFRIVGVREKLGKMGSVWRDNLLLERRSKVIGVNDCS